MAVALRRVESVIHDLRCPCRSALARDEAFLGKPPSRASLRQYLRKSWPVFALPNVILYAFTRT
ncbi:hypothetical protein VDS06_21700, partial [Xanthomonas campestris pv. campestris]|nr:hypothetical protein [Xanthomonas campestris pv. campestris]